MKNTIQGGGGAGDQFAYGKVACGGGGGFIHSERRVGWSSTDGMESSAIENIGTPGTNGKSLMCHIDENQNMTFISPSNYIKPRITKVAGTSLWSCTSRWTKATDVSPLAAYDLWREITDGKK